MPQRARRDDFTGLGRLPAPDPPPETRLDEKADHHSPAVAPDTASERLSRLRAR